MSNNPLPEIGLLRLRQIIGNPKADPPIPPIIPVSKSTWKDGCKDGRFPSPIKLAPGIVCWRVEDIRAFINGSFPQNKLKSSQPIKKTPSKSNFKHKPCQLLVSQFIFDAVAKCVKLSSRAKLIMVFLCQYAQENNDLNLSYCTIGKAVGVQRRHAMKTIRELENFGLIRIVKSQNQNGSPSANSYIFLWHEIYQEQLDNIQDS